MPSALPPSSPVSLDANVPLSITQISPDATTAFANVGQPVGTQAWVNPGLLDQYQKNPAVPTATISDLGSVLKYKTNTDILYSYSMPTSNLDQTFTATPLEMPIKDNQLNQYANYTYHIRFSMANEWSAYNADISKGNSNRRIIAESGKTVGFNITKFSMNQTLGPGFKHQNINATTWRMTITEPFGLTLADAMQAAATELQVKNHHRFPLFIEIWFNGYDEEGNLIPKIDGVHKIWRVIILNCSLQTTESGTVYELDGITDNDLSATNEIAFTPSFINLNKIRTLDEAIKELEKKLNSESKSAENQPRPITYKVELPEEMKSWKLLPSNVNEQVARERDARGGILTLAKGQDIGAFIITAISKCEESKNWLEGAPNERGGVAKASVQNDGLARYIQVVPKMEIGAFNDTLRDYVRTITYYVVPFYTPRCASSVEEIQALRRPNVQINKFNFWCQNHMLSKRYEYIYTGKNTEIIKFDISIENLWQIIVPAYLGAMNYHEFAQGPTLAESSQAVSRNRNYPSQYKLGNEISARFALFRDLGLSGGSLSGASLGLNNFNNTLNSINSSVTSIGNSISNVTSTLGVLSSNFGLSGVSSGLQNISGGVSSLTSSASNALGSLGILTSLPITQFNYSFTDITIDMYNNVLRNGTAATPSSQPLSGSEQDLKDRFIEEIVKKDPLPDDTDPLQIAAWISNEPTQQQSTLGGLNPKSNTEKSGDLPRSQAMFGTKVFNIYERAYFLEITMEIRGDPYWIGPSNLEVNEFLKDKNNISGSNSIFWPKDKNIANYLQGENVFLLNFRTGTDYDEETGLMKANTASQYFSGLYAVTEVESRFDSGKFTQVLSAYKEPFSQTMNKKLISSVAPNVTSSNNLSNVPGIIGGGNTPTNNSVAMNNLSDRFKQFGTTIA